MKKALSFLLAVVMMAALLAGCSGSAPAETKAPEAKAPTAAPAEKPEQAADPYQDMEAVVFNIATSYKEGSDYINALQAACDVIAEKTNGKVSFVIYPGNQLGSTADVTELMLGGANIAAGLGMANLSGYIKEAAIPGYPYVVNNYEGLSNLFSSQWWEDIKVRLADEWNMVPIMAFSVGYRNMIGSVPVSSPEDLAPVITRIGLGTIGQDFITVCGGTPTTTAAFSDCYSAIQTRMFELCEADCELLYTSGLNEVSSNLSVTHHMTNPAMFAVHKSYWDKIPEAYQEIVLEELDKAGAEIWNTYSVKENEWIQKFADDGVNVVYPEDVDVEAFKALTPKLMERQGVSPEEYQKVVAAVSGQG